MEHKNTQHEQSLPNRPWGEVVKEWFELNETPGAKDSERYKQVHAELKALTEWNLRHHRSEMEQMRKETAQKAEESKLQSEPSKTVSFADRYEDFVDVHAPPEEWERARQKSRDERLGRHHSDDDDWTFGR